MSKGKIIVCSAPSGAGKTTLLNRLGKAMPDLVYSISATTRKPRRNERDGEQYFFLEQEEFKNMINRGEFAEWQLVHGNYYGTPCAFVDKTVTCGRHLIMDIDVKGRIMFASRYPDAKGILILPPSFEILEQRLRRRGTEREEDIRIRLGNARAEVDTAKSCKLYEYTVINDDIEKTSKDMIRIVREIINGI